MKKENSKKPLFVKRLGRGLLFFNLYFGYLYGQGSHWFNEPKFQQLLDQKTQSVAHQGNRVELLIDGVEAMKRRVSNLTNADVIFLKTFEFWGDETGGEILRILTDRAKQGAKVFIQFELKGTWGGLKPEALNEIRDGTFNPLPQYLQKFLEETKGNGFVIPTNMPYSLVTSNIVLFKDHSKMFVTWDSQNPTAPVKAIVGGINTGDMYLLGGKKDSAGNFKHVAHYQSLGFSGEDSLPLRDTDVEVIGPVNYDIVRKFIESVEFHLKNPKYYFLNILPEIKTALQELKEIENKMLKRGKEAFPDNLGKAYCRFIYQTAKDFDSKDILNISNFFDVTLDALPHRSLVRFATGFFLPTKSLWRSMSVAARKGVYFDILINGSKGPESSIAIYAPLAKRQMLHFLKTMPGGSVDFYEWQGAPADGLGPMMHQKVYSFGNKKNDPCGIGSFNLNGLGLIWDAEALLVIQDPEFKTQLDAMLNKDFSEPRAKKVTLDELKSASFIEKVKTFFLDKIAKEIL